MLISQQNIDSKSKKIFYNFEDKFDLKTTTTIDEFVDNEWNKLLEKAKMKGGQVWDGDVYRIRDINGDKNRLNIKLSKVKYRNLKAAKKMKSELFKLDSSFHPRGGVVSAIIKTSDNLFVTGKLPETSMLDKNYNLVGGSMDILEFPFDQNFSIFNFIENEIKEEIGVSSQYILSNNLIGICQSTSLQIVFIFAVTLSTTKNEVLKLHSELKEKEFQELHFSNSEDIIDKLCELGEWKSDIPFLKGFKLMLN